MAVKVRRYGAMLEQETRKDQPTMKAHTKAAVKAGGMGQEADKYTRPSAGNKMILAMLRVKKKMMAKKGM